MVLKKDIALVLKRDNVSGLSKRILHNLDLRQQICVRGAEFSCPRGVRVRADVTDIRGPPSADPSG